VLHPGDRILAIDGSPIRTWTNAVDVIRASADKPLSVTVRRHGQRTSVVLRPVRVTRASDTDPTKTQTVGAVGITAGDAFRHVGPLSAVTQTGSQIGSMLTGTYDVFAHKVKTLGRIYSKNRDPTGFVGAIGISRVSGDILAAQTASLGLRIASFLFLVAGVNLFVGIFNLFPLLPLDGGHLAIVGFEQARHRLRKWLGYGGELRRVDLNKLMPITYAFVVLLAGLTLYIAGADIVNPIKLTQ
jgi:membrane-associated protease RseP (regulator of RpoE activity)